MPKTNKKAKNNNIFRPLQKPLTVSTFHKNTLYKTQPFLTNNNSNHDTINEKHATFIPGRVPTNFSPLQ